MCGLGGIWSPGTAVDQQLLNLLGQRLAHRGPDADGAWYEGDVGMVHRRLAVVDLSSAGAQPMLSRSGRFVLVYNGEIYNTDLLRSERPDVQWRGHSDTEVLLDRLEAFGPHRALAAVDGMFAFALFDRSDRTLWLARDRLGEKPLYCGWIGSRFVFASELSALRTAFATELTLDRNALAGFLRHNYLPAESSAFVGIHKIRPGTLLRLTDAAARRCQPPEEIPYWSLLSAIAAVDPPVNAIECDERLLTLLRRSVRRRMVADVPLGSFLSGGIDSSLVTALLQEASPGTIESFTMGFTDPHFDESPHARRVAEHLGTKHTDMRIDENDLLAVVTTLPATTSEPFADSSFIPTLLLSRLTRQHVTVALSGDGGDELFWGYARYPLWERACRLRNRVPKGLRGPLVSMARSGLVQGLCRHLKGRSQSGRPVRIDRRMLRIAELLSEDDDASLYRLMISHQHAPATLIADSCEPATPYTEDPVWQSAVLPWRRVAIADTLAYLPNDILTKVDRASMAASLETRVPLLDHELVAFAAALPRALVVDRAGGKLPLRRLLARYVPPALTDRPKQGFAVPLDNWLRGPLRPWLLDTLQPSTLLRQGLLNIHPVITMRDAHLAGRGEFGPQLWDLLMLTAWIDQR